MEHAPDTTTTNEAADHPPSAATEAAPSPSIDQLWQAHHGYLVGLASRMLTDRAEAEDAVQEAFAALADQPPGSVLEPGAWLAVVLRRRCLNRLRSAYRRREVPARPATDAAHRDRGGAPSIPALDPVLLSAGPGAAVDPADQVSLDEKVRLALAVLLDRLSPAERTSFLLHDVFGFPFAAVADLVGRSPAACRQLASRGRRDLEGGDLLLADHAVPESVTDLDLVTERFIAACEGGDLDGLLAVLDPDIVGHATVLGTDLEVHAAGAAEVAPRALALYGPEGNLRPLPLDVEGRAGLVATNPRGGLAVVRFDVVDDRITALRALVRLSDEALADILGDHG